jgi:hypothetical protein
MNAKEFAEKFSTMSIQEKFSNLKRLRLEYEKKSKTLDEKGRNSLEYLILWMRHNCFEDPNFCFAYKEKT